MIIFIIQFSDFLFVEYIIKNHIIAAKSNDINEKRFIYSELLEEDKEDENEESNKKNLY